MKIKKKIDIFLDGPTLEEIKSTNSSAIKGFTFNPSLFRANKVTNYLIHCKKLVELIDNKPISLEVIADD